MIRSKLLYISILGIGAIAAGYGLHNHLVAVRAAKLDHVGGTVTYFPPGAIWTQDISHAPLDPQSSTIITWLTDAGGWGTGNMRVDFSLRVLQADASTPRVPFRKAPGFGAADSDVISTIPLPAGGGFEGQTGYQCPAGRSDCHLIVVDRSHAQTL